MADTQVRSAEVGDEPELMDLCRLRHAECGLGAFSTEKVRAVIRRAFGAHGANNPSIIGVIGEGRVEGSIGLVFDEDWDSETPILRCLWNYVLPPYRNSPNLRLLTEWGARLSHHGGAGLGIPMKIETITTRRTESQIRLYKRQLGEPVAITWMCERFAIETSDDELA